MDNEEQSGKGAKEMTKTKRYKVLRTGDKQGGVPESDWEDVNTNKWTAKRESNAWD